MDATRNLQVVITSDSTQAAEGLSMLQGSLINLQSIIETLGLVYLAQQLKDLAIGSVKAASDFQSSMELIQTQAGASTQEVKNMTQAVMDLSSSVGTGPEQLAQGLYHIESAGYSGAKALDILKIAAEGAAVGHANLEDVTNALISVVVSGIGGFNNMSQAMGVLNAIVGSGNMRMQDLVDSLKSGIVPVAKTFGMSIQDVGAALATLTDNGVPAIDASTRLRMEFSLLADPTTKAAKELEKIGLSSRSLADDMRSGGIVQAMTDLKTHLDALKDPVGEAQLLSSAFGGGRSSSGILTLIDQLDRLKSKYTEINGATTTFGSAWAETQKTAAYQIGQFQANIQKFSIVLGNAFLPALTLVLGFLNSHEKDIENIATAIGKNLTPYVQFLTVILQQQLTPVLKQLQDLWEKHQKTLIEIATFLAGVFITAVVAVIVIITTAIAIITALTQAFTALTEFLQKYILPIFDNVKQKFQQSSDFITKTLVPAINLIANAFDTVAKSIENAINWLSKWAGNVNKTPGIGGTTFQMPHFFATGVSNFSGGLAIVGEQGPELVNLPSGSSVIPSSQTQQMLGQKQGGINITINYPQLTSQQSVQQMIYDIKRALGRDAELAKLGAL